MGIRYSIKTDAAKDQHEGGREVMFTFSGEELDVYRGPWTAEKIDLVRRYIKHPVNCWTQRELEFAKLLEEAMKRLETPIAI